MLTLTSDIYLSQAVRLYTQYILAILNLQDDSERRKPESRKTVYNVEAEPRGAYLPFLQVLESPYTKSRWR